MSLIIGIAGPSCSGKSTLCENICSKYSYKTEHIRLDDFYKGCEYYPKVNGRTDWDAPSNIDFEFLAETLNELREGRGVVTPIYSKRRGKRIGKRLVGVYEFTLVEGFLLFYDESVRAQMDLKIYIDIAEEEQIRRRMERNPDIDEAYLREVLIPSTRKNVEPTKEFADLIIDGNKPSERVAKELERMILNTTLQ